MRYAIYAPTVPDDGEERCMPLTVPLSASTLIEEMPVYLSLTDHIEPGPAGAGSENSRTELWVSDSESMLQKVCS